MKTQADVVELIGWYERGAYNLRDLQWQLAKLAADVPVREIHEVLTQAIWQNLVTYVEECHANLDSLILVRSWCGRGDPPDPTPEIERGNAGILNLHAYIQELSG